MDEWFKEGEFRVTPEDKNIINQVPSNILLYDESIGLRTAYENFIKNLYNNNNRLSYAFSLYLMTWNIRRFEEYFRKCTDFSLHSYFTALNDEMEKRFIISSFEKLRKKHILHDDVDREPIKNCFESLNTILREFSPLNQNEPIGTIKILHIIAPYYLPLLDNAIARALKFSNLCEFFHFSDSPKVGFIINCINRSGYDYRIKRELTKKIQESLQPMIVDSESYLQYITWVRELLMSVANDELEELEKKMGKSLLKLLDEAFYVRYSIDILRRLKRG